MEIRGVRRRSYTKKCFIYKEGKYYNYVGVVGGSGCGLQKKESGLWQETPQEEGSNV